MKRKNTKKKKKKTFVRKSKRWKRSESNTIINVVKREKERREGENE